MKKESSRLYKPLGQSFSEVILGPISSNLTVPRRLVGEVRRCERREHLQFQQGAACKVKNMFSVQVLPTRALAPMVPRKDGCFSHVTEENTPASS